MTPRQRDLMLLGGVLSFVIAGFIVGPEVGFVVLGLALLGTVYLLTPDAPETGGEE